MHWFMYVTFKGHSRVTSVRKIKAAYTIRKCQKVFQGVWVWSRKTGRSTASDPTHRLRRMWRCVRLLRNLLAHFGDESSRDSAYADATVQLGHVPIGWTDQNPSQKRRLSTLYAIFATGFNFLPNAVCVFFLSYKYVASFSHALWN